MMGGGWLLGCLMGLRLSVRFKNEAGWGGLHHLDQLFYVNR